jgi:hypothetical protein
VRLDIGSEHRHRTIMDLMSSPRLAALQPDWTFTPTTAPWRVQIARHRERLRGRVAAPASEVLVPPKGEGAWIVYFVYLPEGRLDPAHRFALDRLRALGRRLLVVCAAPNAAAIPPELSRAADALLWKALPGFDFSLVDLRPWLDRARWDLTGFTATSNVENHVQSYAFHLRDVTPKRLGALTSVMPRRHAFNHFWAVVLWQETRFARVAAKSMSVGSFLYADTPEIEDPTLQVALPLVAAGFPFLKRSLLGKLSHVAEREETLATLAAVGYPV